MQELMLSVVSNSSSSSEGVDAAAEGEENEEEQQEQQEQHVISFSRNNSETGEEQEKAFEKIKNNTKPDDVIILYDNGGNGDIHNRIYVITSSKETTTNVDIEDGDVCTLLLQIGASVRCSIGCKTNSKVLEETQQKEGRSSSYGGR